jgi:hypothetical protein
MFHETMIVPRTVCSVPDAEAGPSAKPISGATETFAKPAMTPPSSE